MLEDVIWSFLIGDVAKGLLLTEDNEAVFRAFPIRIALICRGMEAVTGRVEG